jgi:hypothetical protein
VGQRAIEAQPTDDVLDVDDGVVDDFTERNDQSRDHHRVQRAAPVVEDERSGEERQRNRGQADDGGAPVPQKDDEYDDDEQTANQQGPIQVGDRRRRAPAV